MFSEIFTVICALLGIIGLIFLACYATKWLNKRFNIGNAGRIIKIRECIGIAQDKQLMIVTVGKKNMLIGVTPGAVSKICDLDEEDITAVEDDSVPAEAGFMQSFKKAFAERKNQDAEVGKISESEKDAGNESDDF